MAQPATGGRLLHNDGLSNETSFESIVPELVAGADKFFCVSAMVIAMNKKQLTKERIDQVLDVDLSTGICRWKRRSGVVEGKIAGSVEGYWSIMIDGVSYKRHNLIWFYATGEWAECLVDHRDGNPEHDWIDNLRPATYSQNQQNNHRRKGKSGIKGVAPKGNRWVARVSLNGRTENLGGFGTKEEAALAYITRARELFGEYACAG